MDEKAETECCPNCGFSADSKKKRTVGDFRLEGNTLRKGKTIIHLTRTEAGILESILESHPRPRPVWAIVEDNWGDRGNYVSSEKMVHIYIYKLRKKLAEAGVSATIAHLHKFTPEHGYVISELTSEKSAA